VIGDGTKADRLIHALDRLGQTGTVGRDLAVRLDLVRSVGIAGAWSRIANERRLRRLDDDPDPYVRIWSDAARELGAEVKVLPDGFVEISTARAWTRVWANLVMLDDAVTLRFALQKGLVNDLLRADGLPVPEGLEFDASDLRAALAFLQSGPVPCVVKPAGSSGGYGVTSGVSNEAQLMRARLRAARTDRRLMIERQIPGDAYRFLILDGELLDVVRRHPPRVTGDGRSTIEQLITAENRRRIAQRHEAALWPLKVDLDCVLTLEQAGLSLSTVPPAGVTVPVKRVVSQSMMRDNETVREGVAEELVAEAVRAAQLVGLRLAGVDLITPDPGESMAGAGGAILEVNGPPGLNYHYDVADPGNATRVAVPILRKLLSPKEARRPPHAPGSLGSLSR
jgi:cyanophycin synthetase